ncbi:type II secretion system protein [Parachitinimonas caeni]|uniref:Type II secretion system protein n=1 Tax=Parachitinimonas caeni TaxID=3031301 RepID=A0ABT7E2A1_9NEIS|nr:type II secretion system protein [Parachitinimonas caeni]MDK2126442.1 type II secretion system protein [Parachitinimonas caeni]
MDTPPAAAQRGFTLIELLVSLTLLAILAGAALPLTQLQAQRSKEQELRLALREIRAGIDAFKQASDEGKIEKAADATGYPKSLRQLVEGAIDKTSPDQKRIYFLRRIPRDPFFPDANTPAEQTWALRSYASPPDAPAAGDDVFDVFSLNPQTGLNGRPYREW